MNNVQEKTDAIDASVSEPQTNRWGCILAILLSSAIVVFGGYVSITAWLRQQEFDDEQPQDYTTQIDVEQRLDNSTQADDVARVSFVERFLKEHPAAPDEHELGPLLVLSEQTLENLRQNVRDYTGTIVKQERVGGSLLEAQFLTCKIRQEQANESTAPFSVYLRFLEPDSVRGREVIWVRGENEGRLLAHEGGWKNLTTLRLQPDSKLAMIGNRYPITEIGIENLLIKLLEIGRREMELGTCEVEVKHDLAINGRPTSLVLIRQSERREGQRFYRAEIYLDHELEIPVRYAAYDWPESEGSEPLLLEQYTYTDLKLNVGLTDDDFSPENPKYKFH